MATIVRNGTAYGEADVTIAMFGSIEYEITALSYGVTQAHTANYSFGSDKPTSYSMGRKTYSCSITMRLDSASAIEKAAGGDLLGIKPFDIVVHFVNDDNESIQDRIKAKFASQTHKPATDKEEASATFTLFCLDIQFNANSGK